MSEVLFYHLTESKLEDALPPLLDKSLDRGWRVAVQTGTPERRDALDGHLWTWREESFLPHGTDEHAFSEEQPVLLTTIKREPLKTASGDSTMETAPERHDPRRPGSRGSDWN